MKGFGLRPLPAGQVFPALGLKLLDIRLDSFFVNLWHI